VIVKKIKIRYAMKYKTLLLIFFLVIIACQTVPITGRQQLSIIPAGQMLSMSSTSYREFLSANSIISNTEDAKMVKQVGVRIQRAVEKYFSDRNLSESLSGYEWEFNLVDDKTVNAWCMPGGKVVVYSGILPVARDDKGLAVVMGHEIAHAVANHGEERMSQGLIAQMGGMALSTALANKPKQTSDLFMTAFGIGAQVGVLLPYGRLQESEADRLGLIFMAMAGYDPHEAPKFWERMSSGKQGAAPPEFLSTHPADETRIRNLEKQMPEALSYYRKQ